MPLYEYICYDCGCEFEKIVPVKERHFVTCPECGGLARKKMSIVNNSFGWKLADECHYVKGTPDKFVKNV